jgi:hypothetical protein
VAEVFMPDEKIRLAEEFIEAAQQMVFPLEAAGGNAPLRGPETGTSAEEIIHELTIAFAEFFSEEELKGLIAFYRSPLGLRMIEARSALAPRLAKMVRDRYRGRDEEWASRILLEPSG